MVYLAEHTELVFEPKAPSFTKQPSSIDAPL